MIFIQKLLEKKIITKEQGDVLMAEFKEFKGTEEQFLLGKKVVKENELNTIKAEIFNMPFFESAEVLEVPSNVLSMIPEESARVYKIVPLGLQGNVLEVGIVNPDDIKAKEALNFLSRQSKITYKTYLISESSFEAFLRQYRNVKEEVGKALSALETELGGEENVELFRPTPSRKASAFPKRRRLLKWWPLFCAMPLTGALPISTLSRKRISSEYVSEWTAVCILLYFCQSILILRLSPGLK